MENNNAPNNAAPSTVETKQVNAVVDGKPVDAGGLKIKSKVKAGRVSLNHNETSAMSGGGLRIKSKVKAGRVSLNHNEKPARTRR